MVVKGLLEPLRDGAFEDELAFEVELVEPVEESGVPVAPGAIDVDEDVRRVRQDVRDPLDVAVVGAGIFGVAQFVELGGGLGQDVVSDAQAGHLGAVVEGEVFAVGGTDHVDLGDVGVDLCGGDDAVERVLADIATRRAAVRGDDERRSVARPVEIDVDVRVPFAAESRRGRLGAHVGSFVAVLGKNGIRAVPPRYRQPGRDGERDCLPARDHLPAALL